MDVNQFNTALLEANGISPWFAGIIMQEIEGLRAENARLKAALDAAQAKLSETGMTRAVEHWSKSQSELAGENRTLRAALDAERAKISQMHDALEEVELHHGFSFSGTTKDQVKAALADTTPPPAVVPLVEVEKLAAALHEVLGKT